jgi:hypothetical protein
MGGRIQARWGMCIELELISELVLYETGRKRSALLPES